jgi:hypothetical protein
MTTRDRLFGMCIAAAAILAAMWFLLVSPERSKISGLNAEVTSAQQALSTAQSKLSSARSSQASYQTDYASIVKLGEAVPPTPQVPSLVYELDQLSNSKDVDFESISASAASSGASAASSTAAASTATGFSAVPFTFTFNGSFVDLYNLLDKLNGLVVQTSNGGVQISGRLLTIQSADLAASTSAPATGSTTKNEKTSISGNGELTGTITATAYVLPAAQGLTAGATPAGPAGITATTPQPASTSAPASSPTPAAAIKVTP